MFLFSLVAGTTAKALAKFDSNYMTTHHVNGVDVQAPGVLDAATNGAAALVQVVESAEDKARRVAREKSMAGVKEKEERERRAAEKKSKIVLHGKAAAADKHQATVAAVAAAAVTPLSDADETGDSSHVVAAAAAAAAAVVVVSTKKKTVTRSNKPKVLSYKWVTSTVYKSNEFAALCVLLVAAYILYLCVAGLFTAPKSTIKA